MRIRFLLVVFIGFFLEIQLIGQVSFGEVTNINEGWKFKNKELVDEFNSKLNTDNWNTVNLPHDWSVESNHSPNLASCTGYLPGGIGWYKKSILIPVSDSGKLLFLYFGGVYCNSEVWINDHLLGKRPNGYISFMYEMTRYINYGSENTILVKVDHSKSADSRWYTGSGIYRDVYLVKSGPVHIDQWGVACSSENITQKQAVISVKTTIRNSTQKPVTVTVLEKINLKGDSRIVATVKKQIKIN